MADISGLVQKRGQVRASLTNIGKFANKIDASIFTEQIESRLEKLEILWKEFTVSDDKLMSLGEASASEDFQEKFFDIKALLTRAMRGRHATTANNDETIVTLNTSIDSLLQQQKSFFEGFADHSKSQLVDVRLPRISIDPFYGEIEKWPTFKDLFVASVHNNDNISNAHKFKFLKGLLKGSAERLLTHIPVTDASYVEAWEKLCQRFDKKKNIINALIQNFMNQSCKGSLSAKTLRATWDISDEVVRALKALGPESESRDPWLIYILLQKLDLDTQKHWAEHSIENDFPKFQDFLDFLDQRCNVLESCQTSVANTISHRQQHTTANVRHQNSPHNSITKPRFNFAHAAQISPNLCSFCQSSHALFRCYRFQRLDLEERRKFIADQNLCLNCMRNGHQSNACPSKFKCIICDQPHHTTLHIDTNTSHLLIADANTAAQTDSSNPSSSNIELISSFTTLNLSSQKVIQSMDTDVQYQSLLPTALVYIKDSSGSLQHVRAMLDSGSQSTFVTDSCVKRLGLTRSHSRITVSGLAGTQAGTTMGAVSLELISRYKSTNAITVSALVLAQLTSNIPSFKTKISNFKHLNHLELADPYFNTPKPIDVLIGADIFFHLLCNERLIKENLPIAQLTIFGWVVSGPLSKPQTEQSSTQSTICNYADINTTLQRFWELEEVPSSPQLTEEELFCEKLFKETHQRDEGGRYIVHLPLVENAELGNSFYAAKGRLISMEKRFNKDNLLRDLYVEFMDEYISLGHMELIPEHQINLPFNSIFYLPHHAVLKMSSSTTKLRVVFDGSCKTSNGKSLNDNLLSGPNLQSELVNILLRFRKHPLALTADMEKMYRQVWVHNIHTDFQRILWRKSPDQKINHYRLKTVTYGTKPASYLAVRSVRQVVIDHATYYQMEECAALEDYYVDDFLSGCENLEEAACIYNKMISLLNEGGFRLRKWMSNSKAFLDQVPVEDRETKCLEIDEETSGIKTLGLYWNPNEDTFQFKVNIDFEKPTKRSILSVAAKIYDPLGWLSPSTIQIKIMFQELWLKKLEWDDPIPSDIEHQWSVIRSNLPELEKIRIPRHLNTYSTSKSIELHAFCDASESAYATCAYLRVEDCNGTISTILLASKTKVAPLNQISLPRLELCGAVLLCKLTKFIKKSLKLHINYTFAWTDSKIVLAWLSNHPRKWQTFVGNRTSQILQDVPRHEWNYVPSKQNPADCASRGISPATLADFQLWWTGPTWLNREPSSWPATSSQVYFTALKLSVDARKANNVPKYTLNLQIARPNTDELHWAENFCIKSAQDDAFHPEISTLLSKQQLPKASSLRSLTPFIDEFGLLRVGGRLEYSTCTYDTKHPIILPKGHLLSKEYIRKYHKKFLHPGSTLLVSLILQRFWILGCRSMAKEVVHKCLICFRHKQTHNEQLMANLPKNRVSSSRPFLSTGIDFAGPVFLRQNKLRGRSSQTTKAYIALFICFSVKAVHIELVSDMSTEAYIAALRRFISRRGIPAEITSDNGTNLVGSRRALNDLHNLFNSQYHINNVSSFLDDQNIKFNFNPPSAPHFGGLWEANIKSVKAHLKRVVGDTSLTFEEMTTLLTQIEAVLNSRPLCPQGADITSYDALTPAHFLIGEPLTLIPEPDLTHIKESHLSKWQHLQNRLQGFWRRWSLEYLTTLQRRPKWQQIKNNLELGQMIVIKETNSPPGRWSLGRITKLHPGHDGLTRVATVKTNRGELIRPIVKLVPLPLE